MFERFHAHIYYDKKSRGTAERVRRELGENFQVVLGRWHDDPVGPHPGSMYQVAFEADQFESLTQWLMAHRGGLTVFVHPETGDDLGDHRDRALWMGRLLKLDLSKLG